MARHWWNGTWGRLGRRDVYVWTDGHRRWAVEARTGGADGRSRWREVHGEREALELARRWREAGGDGWRDVMRLRRDPPDPGDDH